jgi:hypothetical protein
MGQRPLTAGNLENSAASSEAGWNLCSLPTGARPARVGLSVFSGFVIMDDGNTFHTIFRNR